MYQYHFEAWYYVSRNERVQYDIYIKANSDDEARKQFFPELVKKTGNDEPDYEITYIGKSYINKR